MKPRGRQKKTGSEPADGQAPTVDRPGSVPPPPDGAPTTHTSRIQVGPLHIRSKSLSEPPKTKAAKPSRKAGAIPPTHAAASSQKTEKIPPPATARNPVHQNSDSPLDASTITKVRGESVPRRGKPAPDVPRRHRSPSDENTIQEGARPETGGKTESLAPAPLELATSHRNLRRNPRPAVVLSCIAVALSAFAVYQTRFEFKRIEVAKRLEALRPPVASPAGASEISSPEGAPPAIAPPPPSPPPAAPAGAESSPSQATSETITRTLERLQRELEIAEGRNQLRYYADQAIATGSRFAFRQLQDARDSPAHPVLADAAEAEALRVESHYVTTRRFRKYAFPLAEVFTGARTVADVKPNELLWAISDPALDWEIRAFAARTLVRFGDDPDVPSTLVRSAQTESDLRVLQEMIVSFGQITGFYASSIFAAGEASAWWARHSPDASRG